MMLLATNVLSASHDMLSPVVGCIQALTCTLSSQAVEIKPLTEYDDEICMPSGEILATWLQAGMGARRRG